MAEAVNFHLGATRSDIFDLESRQNQVALISEMYHVASLYHDDVIDGAFLRRNKPSVNYNYGNNNSITITTQH